MKIYIPDNLDQWFDTIVPVGSRVTCNPPPKNTDQDLLILQEGNWDVDETFLTKHSWKIDPQYDVLNFISYHKVCDTPYGKDKYNIIMTQRKGWFEKFLDATMECKKANILDKAARIKVFEQHLPQKKASVKFKSINYLSLFNEPAPEPEPQGLSEVEFQNAIHQLQQSVQAVPQAPPPPQPQGLQPVGNASVLYGNQSTPWFTTNYQTF